MRGIEYGVDLEVGGADWRRGVSEANLADCADGFRRLSGVGQIPANERPMRTMASRARDRYISDEDVIRGRIGGETKADG